MKAKYIIGIIIIGLFSVWGASSFMSTTILYVSIDEVAKTEGTVQLMGKIDFDAVNYDAENSRLVFEVVGLEEHTADDRLTIVYTGVVPGNFDQATSVVAKGHYEDGVFLADQLLVKCPSKYQGMEEKA
ncbi:MAG: cytochrome c maturation protein CcmE [FCB group bacterium]|nr:cytochrome c maturation protein CcmE [FCB group bacterium]